MSRQLFIHHYLPSHLASALVAGSVLSFVLSETVNYPISVRGPATRLKPSTYADVGMKGPIIVGLFVIAMFVMFCYIAPLTYGTPGYVVLLTQACGFVAYVLYADWTATKLTRGGSSRRGPCTLRRSPRTFKQNSLVLTWMWMRRLRERGRVISHAQSYSSGGRSACLYVMSSPYCITRNAFLTINFKWGLLWAFRASFSRVGVVGDNYDCGTPGRYKLCMRSMVHCNKQSTKIRREHPKGKIVVHNISMRRYPSYHTVFDLRNTYSSGNMERAKAVPVPFA